MIRIALALAALLAFHIPLADAQTPTRIRGTIERVDDQSLTVKSREGETLKIAVPPNLAVVAVSKTALADIKPGAFVGAAALPEAGGGFKAQEVLVFPEAMRGTGEGHYPWDLSPGSTMTNATVDMLVSGSDGTSLTLKHKGGDVKVLVPTDTPIVTLGPGDRALLVPGAGVFVPATRAVDGTLSTARVLVGTNGLMPPM